MVIKMPFDIYSPDGELELSYGAPLPAPAPQLVPLPEPVIIDCPECHGEGYLLTADLMHRLLRRQGHPGLPRL